MKKVLFATTALVATAGVAAADVSLSGSAEMGIKDSSTTDIEFHTDIAITFTLSGQTDNGLSFGASVGLEEAQGGIETDIEDDFSVFMSGDFGTITMGDTDGALDWAVTEVGMAGSIADDHTSHAGYSGNGGFNLNSLVTGFTTDGATGAGIGLDGFYDGQILRYNHTIGSFGFAASLEIADDRTLDEEDLGVLAFGSEDLAVDLGAVFGVGMKYSENGLSLGLGYQMAGVDINDAGNAETIDFWSVAASAGYEIDGFNIVANIGRTEMDVSLDEEVDGTYRVDHIALGASYTMDAVTVAANWGQYTYDVAGEGSFSESGFGLAANYDLGGGAVAQIGYGHSNNFEADDAHSWSLGVAMSF
jgi:outer membrane protein OmpU